MKRLYSLLLCIALLLSLTACTGGSGETQPGTDPSGSTEPKPSETTEATQPAVQLRFTREDFPRLNGSTSTVPLGQAIASVLLGESREDVADLIQFSKTTQSFRELMSGKADLLISAEPAESIWQEKEENGFEWEMEPFAIDGLVFIVNADNPVDSLTVEQIRKIYTGEITDWSEVGGEDLDIVPFQRNAEAGSQTAMLKLVMGDLPMMDAPTDYVMSEMGALIKAVASYDGTAAAIGYTVYYYANDMKMADGLKILAVEGVTPDADTIRSGDYPFLNNYYVLVAAGLPEDAPAKRLYNWILSREGQRLVAHEGYVSVMDVEDDGHWPWLKPYEQGIYTYSDRYRKGEPLEAGNDYGTLLPYVGLNLPVENYLIDRLPMYGLVTAKGEIVTDAIYADIIVANGFLVLYRGSDKMYQESKGQDSGVYALTVAAGDGSWLRKFEGSVLVGSWAAEGGLLAIGNKAHDLIFLDGKGRTVASYSDEDFRTCFGKSVDWTSWEERPWLEWYDGLIYAGNISYVEETGEWKEQMHYLDLAAGEILEEAPAGFPNEPVYTESPMPPSFPNYANSWSVQDVITGTTYYEGFREGGGTDLLDENGAVVWKDYSNAYALMNEMVAIWPGRFEEGNTKTTYFSWYDLKTGECVFHYPIGDNLD